ncbi:MFS transporter [Pontibacillus marinus]|uniref:MFS transporter n=1 Tax=Pontibacillus marinus TaxID=273164 RepID=UPI00040F8ECF|nr:MFS transporter [Pontibacillus marinus]
MLFSVFGTTLFLTMMVFHLKDTIMLATTEVGWLLSFGGGSAIVGSFISPWLRKHFSYQMILFVGGVIGGSSIFLFGMTSTFIWLVLMNMVGIVAASIQSPCIITIRQTLTPKHLLGRVQATSRFMTWVLMPFAALLAGWTAQHFGTAMPIKIGGVLSILASFLYLHPALKTS